MGRADHSLKEPTIAMARHRQETPTAVELEILQVLWDRGPSTVREVLEELNRTREPGADFQEWIRYDIEYVRRASMLFDLEIMARTAWMMVRGRPHRASD